MPQGTGFLQSDVPCPQERGQITSDNQPKTTQSVCANASFHHDNPEGCEPTHPAGGLGRVFGPERRLFSCAGPHTSQTLSPVYMEGTDVSIHSLALRPVHQPLLLHESDRTSCTVPTLTGRQGSVLSGRCVAASSDQTRRTREQEKSRASVGQTRFLSKPREIRLRAPAVFFLPRTSVGHPFNAGSLARGQGGGDTLFGSQSSRPEDCVGKKPDDLFGEGDVCVLRCRAGSTPLAGAANCSEDSLQTPTGHMQDSTPTQGGSPQSRLLERAEPLPSPSAPLSSGDNYGDGRFVIGMGRQSSRIIGQWPLVQGSEVTPHKLPGTDGRREFAAVISGQGGREDCVRPDRQQNCSGLPGEGRGHKVGTAVPPGLPNPVVVPTASGNPDPCVRERDRQHNCGRPVQGAGDTMAPVTKDGGQDLSAVRDPPGRPVCLQGDSPVTPVHDSPAGGQSSPGSGRSQSDVGLRPGVRFPPSDACPDGGQQAQGLQGQNAANSTLLVRRSVDASPDGTPVRHASPDPHVSEAPDQHGDQLLGGQRGGPEADCMANMRSATGLNLPSATFALLENSWRPSTRRQYQAVWKEWSKFCQNESMDPSSICVESMLGYLQYLFDKGFAWRSIGVHRSALSSILEAHKPVPVGQHPLVCRFVRGVFNKRPPSVRVVPTWDIGQVLMYLSKDHPPEDLSLFRLTAKVLFLLAAFTAKRVSDLVLFSVDSSLCHVTDECIVLQTQFGSKTDRPGHRSPPVTLRKCEEESLCPVRYVSAYKERTEPLRQASGTQQLFISPFTQRPVKLATLRRWMVKVMREAGVIASAGSTRATVTSCALLHDVPLQQLLNSADWTREDTPFRHYVRVLPERTLRSISSQRSLQDAVLAQHERE